MKLMRGWLLGTAAALLVGCSGSRDRAEFVFINGSEPESLDPAIVTGQPEGRLCNALFEGLCSRDKTGALQPGVAERWTVSPDGLTVTFFLRETARWSNGDPVTAHDFAASWKRTLSPETASGYAYILFCIDGAEAYQTRQLTDFNRVGVRAVDAHTFQVRLRAPTAYFLDLCAFVTSYPVHMPSLNAHPTGWTKPGRLVSNGAFKLEAWRINDRVRLRKNPHYWRAETVAFNTVDALPIDHAMTAFSFYATGVADLILDKGNVPTLILDSLKKRPDFHAAPFLGTFFLRFNVTRPPFDDVRVRRAFALALDKEAVVTRATRAGEPPASSFTPPGLAGFTPPAGLKRDPDQARALLAEAGFPDGRGFPSVSLLYNTSELNKTICEELQLQLRRELNIPVELRNQEWKVYLSSLDQLDFDLGRSSWVGDYPDPNTFLDCFLAGSGNNRTGWAHPPYDALILEANSTVDAAKRMELLQRAETILVEEELPIVPVYFYVGLKMFDSNRLGGLVLNVIDEYPLREMYWKAPPGSNPATQAAPNP